MATAVACILGCGTGGVAITSLGGSAATLAAAAFTCIASSLIAATDGVVGTGNSGELCTAAGFLLLTAGAVAAEATCWGAAFGADFGAGCVGFKGLDGGGLGLGVEEYEGLWPAAEIAMPYLRRRSEILGGEGIAKGLATALCTLTGGGATALTAGLLHNNMQSGTTRLCSLDSFRIRESHCL